MKLARFLIDGDETPRAGEVEGEEVVAAGGKRFSLADVRLLAPAAPRAIFGIGLNYADHAAETGQEPPPVPIVFMKLPSSSAPPNEPVPVPAPGPVRFHEAPAAPAPPQGAGAGARRGHEPA